MEGARISGASRIIGVDLNPAKFELGNYGSFLEPGKCHFSTEFKLYAARTLSP
jgi:Zn-dependent alcohol dehydrogenase